MDGLIIFLICMTALTSTALFGTLWFICSDGRDLRRHSEEFAGEIKKVSGTRIVNEIVADSFKASRKITAQERFSEASVNENSLKYGENNSNLSDVSLHLYAELNDHKDGNDRKDEIEKIPSDPFKTEQPLFPMGYNEHYLIPNQFFYGNIFSPNYSQPTQGFQATAPQRNLYAKPYAVVILDELSGVNTWRPNSAVENATGNPVYLYQPDENSFTMPSLPRYGNQDRSEQEQDSPIASQSSSDQLRQEQVKYTTLFSPQPGDQRRPGCNEHAESVCLSNDGSQHQLKSPPPLPMRRQ